MRMVILRAVLGALAVLFCALTLAVSRDSVDSYTRLRRLRTEGRPVVGTIVSIDIERTRPAGKPQGKVETWRLARVQYEFNGADYLPLERHVLTGATAQLGVGDSYRLLVLPDQPARPIAPDAVAGSWFALVAQPLLLVAISILALWCTWKLPSLVVRA